jgi:tRNA (guanine10-N2)-dimethyltransferase
MRSLMILGRQPELGLAELESLYGADKIRPVGGKTAVVDVDPCLLAFDRLGGSVKFCKILTELETTDWKEIEKFLLGVSPGHSRNMPEGKMRLGLSDVNLGISPAKLNSTGLALKKAIKKTGRNVRVIPNKSQELNAAQVLHNQLTGPTGWELVFIKDGKRTIVAQTVKAQDITSYTKRDRGRPKRDPKIGMLPPKLAQIIINLAAGKLSEETLTDICEIPEGREIPLPRLEKTLLDPFCGTGVVLQEAALMGYEAYGTDLDERMVDYSEQNMRWLCEQFRLPAVCCRVEQGDATDYQWQDGIDMVAGETYLGSPFTSLPDSETLERTANDCNLIIKKFLRNVHGQLKPGTRLCLAVPAWQTATGKFKHLPLVDQISALGYNRISFEHSGDEELIYHRKGQVVARQLLVITRK